MKIIIKTTEEKVNEWKKKILEKWSISWKSFSVSWIEWNYSFKDWELLIVITSKPRYVPESIIEDGIKKFFN